MTLKLLSLLADCVTEKAVDETADIISGKKEKKTADQDPEDPGQNAGEGLKDTEYEGALRYGEGEESGI